MSRNNSFNIHVRELIDEENMSSKMTDEELIQNYINFAKNVWGTKVTEDEARKTLAFEESEDPLMQEIRVPVNVAGSAADPSQGGRPSNGPSN